MKYNFYDFEYDWNRNSSVFPAVEYSRIYSQEIEEGGNWIFLGHTAPVKKGMGEGIGSRYPIDTYAKPRPVVAPSVHEWTHGHLRNYSPSRAAGCISRPHEVVVTVGHESRQRVRRATTSLLARYTTPLSRANVVQTFVFMSYFIFFLVEPYDFHQLFALDAIPSGILEAGRTIYVSLRNSIYRSCNLCIRFLIIPKMDHVFCIKCINRCHESSTVLPIIIIIIIIDIFKVRFSTIVYIVSFSVSLFALNVIAFFIILKMDRVFCIIYIYKSLNRYFQSTLVHFNILIILYFSIYIYIIRKCILYPCNDRWENCTIFRQLFAFNERDSMSIIF